MAALSTSDPLDLSGAPEGMSVNGLVSMVSDIQNQPAWRHNANKAMRYYDGKQLTSEQIAEKEDTGQPKVIVNLVQRVINGVLGQEARSRTDWKVTADTDWFSEVAEALNAKMHEAQREAYMDDARSDAYKGQLVSGIGWVEVSRDPDPLNYPYRVREVHRNEMFWDWRARDRGLRDAKWVCRCKWVDLDAAIAKYPQHADALRYVCANSGELGSILTSTMLVQGDFAKLDDARSTFSVIDAEEWLSSGNRKRVKFYEIWYKVPAICFALILPAGRRMLFDPTNPLHLALVDRGIAQPVRTTTYVMRQAIFAGPYKVVDVPTKRRNYPYIPFWCYRDDEDRTPYGVVDGMISPQDEFNERRSKLLWLLKAKQIFVDDDALNQKFNTFVDLATEAMRPDAVFVLNSSRKNANGLTIRNDTGLSAEQVNVMQDARQLVQDVPGIYSSMLGNAPAGVTSGYAINSLVEQGLAAMGEVNDNYRFGSQLVGEALLDLIIEDYSYPDLRVRVRSGQSERVIVLNTADPQTGAPLNPVKDAAVKVALSDVPTTPAFRMQQQQQIGTVLQAVGPDPVARAVLLPAFIESTDLQFKDEYAQWMRSKYGVPDPSQPVDKQQQAQAQQQADAQAQVAAQIQAAAAQAKIDREKAAAARDVTAAQLNQARAEHLGADLALRAQAQADKPLAANDGPTVAGLNPTQAINDALSAAAAG